MTTTRVMRRVAAVVALPGVLSGALAACVAPGAPAHGRHVTAAWARAADAGATGGAYVTVVNADSIAVTLSGVTSPVAQAVEVHESMLHDGMTHMTPRPSITIAAGDSLVMAPGGIHLMLVQLTRALVAGDSIPLTLRFADGDSVRVQAPVRAP